MVSSAPIHAEPSDEELLRLCAANSDAFELLERRYHRRIFSIISRYTHGRISRADLEDLTQESFLRVWRGIPRYLKRIRDVPLEKDGLMGWLYKIAIHCAVDHLRRKGKVVELAEHELRFQEENHESTPFALARDPRTLPEETVMENEHKEIVRLCLSELNGKQRTYLFLSWYESRKNSEIAEFCGVTDATVSKTISRATKAVMDCVRARLELPQRKSL